MSSVALAHEVSSEKTSEIIKGYDTTFTVILQLKVVELQIIKCY